jgi:LuxR family maltose regulon positive regulatory protein
MPADEVTSTAARVDGWAAGVQLFALAARAARASEESNRPALGADVMIHDYVWREVLAHEDPALVQILLDIAVVDRVDSGLAHALTRRPDAGDLLLRAEVRGLFVSRLGPDGWFQVHALIRGALLSQLARTSPGTVARQHARAARWFQAADEVALAVEHWLLADQPRSALRLLAANQHRLYDTGWESTIRRTIAAISVEALVADLDAMLDFAWCHLLVDRRRFVELVEQVTWLAGRGSADAVLEARLMILRSLAATASGQWRLGGGLARQALTAFGDAWWRDPLGRFGWNMIAREFALTESWDDSIDAIRDAESALSYEPSRRVDFEGTRALGEALAGRPVDALRVAAGLRGSMTAVESMASLDAELSTAEAVAHWEIGDRTRALIELEALAGAPAESMLYCRVRALLELTLAYLGEGDLPAARRWFDLAETVVENESFGAEGRDWLARAGTRLALAAGDIDSARSWAEQVDDSFWGPISAARVQLAEGDRCGARESLAGATARCPRHEVVLALLHARAADDREERLKTATSAMERAATCGMLQSVVSEGPEILQLVEQAAWRAPTAWMERLRRAAVRAATLGPDAIHEPLTERERDVLRFLPSRLTLGEIASELYISLNTLKFHLKVIYRKLEVNSRAEAAEVARRMAPASRSSR